MSRQPDFRERLRALKVLAGPFHPVDFRTAPEKPQDLFLAWFEEALQAGVSEPHAMTLSTVDEHGHPDARVLILKNVDERGWHFAISTDSPKGRQIGAAAAVALSFHWKELGRQVRIRGEARPVGAEESARDFLARSLEARAGVLAGRQSAPLSDFSDVSAALAVAKQQLEACPGHVAPGWQVHAVMPREVEFWQGSTDRLHRRLRYQRPQGSAVWDKQLLWP